MEFICKKQPPKKSTSIFLNLYHFKILSTIRKKIICNIINDCRKTSFGNYLNGSVITIPKKENQDTIFSERNFRPITLSHPFYLLWTKHLLLHLENEASLLNCIYSQQFGFSKNKSTLDAYKIHCSNNERFPYVVLLDLKRAFDSVIWESIFIEMDILGFSEEIISELKLLYLPASFEIKGLNTSYIKFRGLRQGCPLSPCILKIITSRVLKSINSKYGVVIAFADDILIQTKSLEDLQKAINEISKVLSLYGFQINYDKTFVYSHLHNPVKSLFCDDIEIKINYLTPYKYLGRWVGSSIDTLPLIKKSINFSLFNFQKLVTNWKTTPDHSVKLYNSLIFPKINWHFDSLPPQENSILENYCRLKFKSISGLPIYTKNTILYNKHDIANPGLGVKKRNQIFLLPSFLDKLNLKNWKNVNWRLKSWYYEIFEGHISFGFAKNYETISIVCPICKNSHPRKILDFLISCPQFNYILDAFYKIWFPYTEKIKYLTQNHLEAKSMLKGHITPNFWKLLSGNPNIRLKFIDLKIKKIFNEIDKITKHFGHETHDVIDWSIALKEAQLLKQKKIIEMKKIRAQNKKRKYICEIEQRKRKWLNKDRKLFTKSKRLRLN